MRKLLIASGAAFFFFSPAHVFGQARMGQAPIEREAPPSRTSNLTLEQHHVIKEIMKGSQIENVPANVRVAVGDTVPQSISLHPMPAEVGARLSQIKTHLFFIQNAKVFIVDPKDKRVVDIID
jgi:hypothetical protein